MANEYGTEPAACLGADAARGDDTVRFPVLRFPAAVPRLIAVTIGAAEPVEKRLDFRFLFAYSAQR